MKLIAQVTELPGEVMRLGGVEYADCRPVRVPKDTGAYKAIRRNMPLIRARYKARMAYDKPLVGDIVIMDGLKMRIAHLWGDSFQPCFGGSFYMGKSGGMSMSGGLEDCHPMEFTLSGDDLVGAWIFENDWTGAHRGLHFNVRVKEWVYTGEIKPYLRATIDRKALQRQNKGRATLSKPY